MPPPTAEVQYELPIELVLRDVAQHFESDAPLDIEWILLSHDLIAEIGGPPDIEDLSDHGEGIGGLPRALGHVERAIRQCHGDPPLTVSGLRYFS